MVLYIRILHKLKGHIDSRRMYVIRAVNKIKHWIYEMNSAYSIFHFIHIWLCSEI